MIDMHTHILPFVDDGSVANELSIDMLKECVDQGVTDVILTPHYRKAYKLPTKVLQNEFEKFNKVVKDANVPINLFLGQEIFIDEHYKKVFIDKKILSMNKSKCVLIEFDYDADIDMPDIVYELKVLGYIPIIAHFERYRNADIALAHEIKTLGALIQVNADSIVGKAKRRYIRLIKKLFKYNLVDFVASDIHYNRTNYLSVAKQFVQKKFGQEVANRVFIENAKKIIKG